MKGQSAIEYVTTYGWAILALVIVLGFIIHYGVLSPSYLISEECNLGSNLPCNFILYTTGSQTDLSTIIYNGFSYKIKITNVSISEPSSGYSFDFGSFTPVEIKSGGNLTITGPLVGSIYSPSSVHRLSVDITYVSCAPELGGCSTQEHTVSGRITGRVLAN